MTIQTDQHRGYDNPNRSTQRLWQSKQIISEAMTIQTDQLRGYDNPNESTQGLGNSETRHIKGSRCLLMQ